MKISTKGRYALRMMLDFALHPGECTKIKDVAARQQISEKYLEIILKSLVKIKLLKGVRGKGGGYRLTRSPEEYVIGEIIELTEGPLAPVACLRPDAEECSRRETCVTLPLWKKYNALIQDFFFHITLKDLIRGEI